MKGFFPVSIWLVMQASDGLERTFPVRESGTIIGREPSCGVRIPLPTVSHKHCQIILDGKQFRLIDLNSDQGTYHNGQRVEESVLADDDTLTIGPVTFKVRVQDDDDPADNGLDCEIVIERQSYLDGEVPSPISLPQPEGSSAALDSAKQPGNRA